MLSNSQGYRGFKLFDFSRHRQSQIPLGLLLHDPICSSASNEQQIRNCLVLHFSIGPPRRYTLAVSRMFPPSIHFSVPWRLCSAVQLTLHLYFFRGLRVVLYCFDKFFAVLLSFVFDITDNRQRNSKLVVTPVQSLWVLDMVLHLLCSASQGTYQIFVSLLVMHHSAYSGWMTECPHVPSLKVILGWMEAADIRSDGTGIMQQNVTDEGQQSIGPWGWRKLNRTWINVEDEYKF